MLTDTEMAHICEDAAVHAIENNDTYNAIHMLNETMIRDDFRKFDVTYANIALKNRNAPIFRYILKIFYTSGEIELSYACELFMKLKRENDVFFMKIFNDVHVMDLFGYEALSEEQKQVQRDQV